MIFEGEIDNCSLRELYRVDAAEDLNTSFICEASKGDFFTVSYGNKVRVLQVKASPSNLDKKLNLCDDYIQPPLFYPTKSISEQDHIGNKSDFDVDLCNFITQPHRIHTLKDDLSQNIVQVKWSPDDLVFNMFPLLAVLSSTGALYIYVKGGIEWILSKNVSLEVTKLCESEFVTQTGNTSYDQAVSKNAYFTTAIAWGGFSKHNNTVSSELFSAQEDGTVFIWNVSVEQAQDDMIHISLKTTFASDFQNIMSAKWITLSSKTGYLVIGAVSGEVQLCKFACSESDEKFIEEKKIIYTEKDRLAVSSVQYSICENFLFLVFIKSIYIIVNVLNGNSLQVEHSEIENLHSDISGCTWINSTQLALASKNNGIFIATINYSNRPNKILQFNRIHVPLTDLSVTSLNLSSNKAIWVYTTVPSVRSYKKRRQRHNIHFSWVENFNLMMNSLLSKTFTVDNTNDFLEIFRLLVLRKQINLKMWVNKLKPIHKDHLKLYTYAMKLNLDVKECNKIDMQYNYKTEELYKLNIIKDRDEILSCVSVLLSRAAVNRISNYCAKRKNELTSFESDALQYCIAFVKKTAIENDQDWTAHFDSMTIKIIETLPEPCHCQCEWCGESFVGVTCRSNHPLQCCCLTFLKIDNANFLTCSCGLLARSELHLEIPMCPVCDKPFQKSCMFESSNNAHE